MLKEEIELNKMIERYKKVHTPAISDILDQKGLFHQVLPPAIQAIESGMRLAGPILTVKGTPTIINKLEYLEIAMKAYELVTRGTIVVFDTGNDPSTAHWGEMLSTTTSVKGCGGAVLDGGVRDVDAILRLDFPVFARYRTPADIRGRWRYIEVNEAIRIGETIIHPGDWAIADSNGVIIVPKELAVEVLVLSEKVVDIEKKIWEELKAGASPIEVFKSYGRF
jgi:4-hydroxy-4-methyl-2-oxoglutarate aldolase